MRFLRLCRLIFALRRFLMEPIESYQVFNEPGTEPHLPILWQPKNDHEPLFSFTVLQSPLSDAAVGHAV
jgi:hypothetical protein